MQRQLGHVLPHVQLLRLLIAAVAAVVVVVVFCLCVCLILGSQTCFSRYYWAPVAVAKAGPVGG